MAALTVRGMTRSAKSGAEDREESAQAIDRTAGDGSAFLGVLASFRVSGKLKTFVVLLMLALLPVRALASVTSGFCAFANQGPSTPVEHAHDSDHGGSPAPGHGHGNTPCSSCVEHCSSAAFAPSHNPPKVAEAPASNQILLYQRSPAGFIPDPLDPPPLAA
ncbi:MAG: hypothetical protein ABR570_13725 [Burkholderiales bacterium]